MLHTNNPINILKYWWAFESFKMPEIRTKQDSNYHTKIQNIFVLNSSYRVPWPIQTTEVDEKNKQEDYQFNIYAGLVERCVIVDKILPLLETKDTDYALEDKKDHKETCIFAFCLDWQGQYCDGSLIFADYIASLLALSFKKDNKHFNWEQLHQNAQNKLSNLKTLLEIRLKQAPLNYEILMDVLSEALEDIALITHYELNDENNVVHLAKTEAFFVDNNKKIERKILNNLKHNGDPYSVESDKDSNKAKPDMIGSSCLNELKELYQNYNNVNFALKKYLGEISPKRTDVRQDKNILNVWLSPKKLPKSCWPEANGYTLSLAQQFAVNKAVSLEQDIFSINGPPGTGKTILLRDIAANAIYNRALALASFTDPASAFSKSPTRGSRVTSWQLSEELFGHEVVVATSNNNAAKNITAELPAKSAIKSPPARLDNLNDYFSYSANCLNEDSKGNWGLISAALDNRGNINNFFQKVLSYKIGHPEELRFKLSYGELDISKYLKDTNSKYSIEDYLKSLEDKEQEKEKKFFITWRNQEHTKWKKNVLKQWQAEIKNFNKIRGKLDQLLKDLQSVHKDIVNYEADIDILARLKRALSELSSQQTLHSQELAKLQELSAKIIQQQTQCKKALFSTNESLTKIAQFSDKKQRFEECRAQKCIAQNQDHEACFHLNKAADADASMASDLENLKTLKAGHDKIKPPFFYLRERKQWRKQYANYIAAYQKIYNKRKLENQLLIDAKEHHAKTKIRCGEFIEKCNKAKKELDIFAENNPGIDGLKYDDIKQKIENLNSNYQVLCKGEISNKSKHQKYIDSIDANSKHINEITFKIEVHTCRLSEIAKNINKTQKMYIGEYANNFMSHNFCEQAYDKLHMTSPWICQTLQDLRNEIFWASIRIHKLFILYNGAKFVSNLNAARLLLRGELDIAHTENYQSIFAALFTLVPVISTTFYSFPRMFQKMKKSGIGWLLIDEAGMTPPQDAAVAIYKANRTIAVGDPLQLTPIVDLPQALSHTISQQYNIDNHYDCREQSAQTILDMHNTLGTYIDPNNQNSWIGAPLVIHRRCNNPMFKISNKIAYNGMMIYGVNNKISNIEKLYPETFWFSLNSQADDNNGSHWKPCEGQVVLSILQHIAHNLQQVAHSAPVTGLKGSVFIISPFSEVTNKFQQFIRAHLRKILSTSDISDFLQHNIGTIHTFQGKQASTVILLLGGDIAKPNAISWVSGTVNMLNVAVTRAQTTLLVVGNYDTWSKSGYFQTLAKYATLINDQNSLNNIIQKRTLLL